MRAKTFAIIKESLAVGRLAAEVGGAQVAKVFQISRKRGGRDLDGDDAERIVAEVGLGRKSMLFRLGNHPLERAKVIDDLSAMMKKAKTRTDAPEIKFNMALCRLFAAVAIDELTLEMCFECKGAGVVRDHALKHLEGRQPMRECPSCAGAKKWTPTEDTRTRDLAREWIAVAALKFESDGEYKSRLAEVSDQFRGNRLHDMIDAIEWGRRKLLTCERRAVEETAGMLERWKPGEE